ncbi:MAG: vanadium-dependent haloperoxidase [Pseudomonadota bacterium]
MPKDRAEEAYRVRVEAAEMARNRTHPKHKANPDEERYAAAHYPMSFTKGLKHDAATGLVEDASDFEAFRYAIDNGVIESFTTRVPVPTQFEGKDIKRRKWEAPTAGVVYDLEGPDAQAVTMPPAPALCSDELAFEMAEVYELALLRDVPITSFDAGGGVKEAMIDASIARLNALPYVKNKFHESNCGPAGRPRKTEQDKKGNCILTRQNVFRGSSPGCDQGPYLSQFLWIGSDDQAAPVGGNKVENGFVTFGAQAIDQRVLIAQSGDDHMQSWLGWRRVQDGVDVGGPGQTFTSGARRFICSPRDLATYVHYDALYQAYLNATLILLGMGTPFDPGFAHLSGMRDVYNPIDKTSIPQNAGGFALYGGPHILTLVTEVATRALKAVRFQKFNNHLRLRPEALAGRLSKAQEIDEAHKVTCGAFSKMVKQLQPTLDEVKGFNPFDPDLPNGNYLLPMAFAEGSPMHPTYGAGHATVAGACTTIVKAFFDTGTVLGENAGKIAFQHEIDTPACFEPRKDGKGKKLDRKDLECPLTLEGELNKLAANISIGRNMAGVHYFSDYYDSLRMGEEIAIGMLQEQAVCYPTDDFVLSIPTFDGEIVRIGRK